MPGVLLRIRTAQPRDPQRVASAHELLQSIPHWEWRIVGRLFHASVMAVSSREFVLCDVCDSALDLECLDESSTASYEELVVQVPLRALLGGGARGTPQRSAGRQWEPTIADALSANSKFRRH